MCHFFVINISDTDAALIGERFIRQTANQGCRRYQWQCQNGECISSDELCDGMANCADESDETSNACISVHCPSYAFRCAYGACVDGDSECNGKKDCFDNSDENSVKCPGVLNALKQQGNCSNFNIQCTSGECISEDFVCDGAVDCKDGSDETVEKCASAYCPLYGFRCGYGGCINGNAKCDGNRDCADGSDENEKLCGYKPKPTTVTPPVVVVTTEKPIVHPVEDLPGSCTLNDIPLNGRVVYEADQNRDVQYGEHIPQFTAITYKCNPRYNISGMASNLCYDGNWINKVPKCQKYCSAVSISGITIRTSCEFDGIPIICDNSLLPGTIARISCQFGYKRPPDVIQDVLVCNEEGNWDSSAFRCDQICGTEAAEGVSYIVGGTKVNITKVPWHVGIYNDLSESGKFVQSCGGTILSAKIVISAAHCFWDPSENKFVHESHFAIGAGKVYRDYYATEPIKSQFIRVAKIHHPDGYNDYAGLYFSDIALLILTDFIVLKSYVKPICIDYDLEYNEQIVPSDWIGRVAGWGLEESGGQSSTELKVIELPAIDYHVCKTASTPQFRPFITGDKFCAGYSDSGLSVCEGDSGGGLVFPRDIGGQPTFYLRGIVSAGADKQGSCDSDKYTTFTNIQFYIKLIISLMANNRPK